MIALKGIWSFIAGGGWKWLLLAGIVSFALKFGYEVYTDYQDLITANNLLIEENATISTTNAANEAALVEMAQQAAINEENRRALELSLRSAEGRVSDLQGLLSRHELEFLAISRPGLIERRMNDATNEVFRSIECSTGGMCPED